MTLQLASDDFPQWINDIEVVDIQFGILAMPAVFFMSHDSSRYCVGCLLDFSRFKLNSHLVDIPDRASVQV